MFAISPSSFDHRPSTRPASILSLLAFFPAPPPRRRHHEAMGQVYTGLFPQARVARERHAPWRVSVQPPLRRLAALPLLAGAACCGGLRVATRPAAAGSGSAPRSVWYLPRQFFAVNAPADFTFASSNTTPAVDGSIPPQSADLEVADWLGENGVPFSIVRSHPRLTGPRFGLFLLASRPPPRLESQRQSQCAPFVKTSLGSLITSALALNPITSPTSQPNFAPPYHLTH